MELVRIRQFGFTLITDTVILLTFQGEENVVLAGIQVMLSILIDIRCISRLQRMDRKFIGILLLLMKRIFHLRHTFQTMVIKAISHISFIKQVWIQPSSRHTSRTQTHTFQRIAADGSVHHTYIKQRFFLFRRRYISGEKDFQRLLRPVINGIGTELRHHLIHRSLFFADFHLPVIIPVSL